MNVPNGDYIVEVMCLGYQAVSDSLHIAGRKNLEW